MEKTEWKYTVRCVKKNTKGQILEGYLKQMANICWYLFNKIEVLCQRETLKWKRVSKLVRKISHLLVNEVKLKQQCLQ